MMMMMLITGWQTHRLLPFGSLVNHWPTFLSILTPHICVQQIVLNEDIQTVSGFETDGDSVAVIDALLQQTFDCRSRYQVSDFMGVTTFVLSMLCYV